MTFSVEIPVPPSVNALFVNVSPAMRAMSKKNLPGRLKTKVYAGWREAAIKTIWATVRADRRIGGEIIVDITLPARCRLDIDNAVKPLLDALVGSQRIDDDKHVIGLRVWRGRAEPTVLIEVHAAADCVRQARAA